MILIAAALATEAPVLPPPEALERAGRRVEVPHLGVLGGWAAANLVGGTLGYFTTDNPRLQGFHATNAAWNTINAALALPGLLGGRNRDVSSLALVQKRHRSLRKALAINVGLDVFYVASGVTLMVAGGELDKPMVRGMGQSIFLQGAFLTVFDLVFLDNHKAIDRKVQVGFTGQGGQIVGVW